MRWDETKRDEMRIKRKFLIFPKCIRGVCKWWEVAEYSQKFTDIYLEDTRRHYQEDGWRDWKWIEKK